MRLISLQSPGGSLRAELAPDLGGMAAQIYLRGRPVLHLDRGALELSPMTAGGIPLLFPFSSKLAGDTYEVDGRTYAMPMHGLIKNAAFGVLERSETRAAFWIAHNPCWLDGQYPFPFRFEVCYEVSGQTLSMTARVHNPGEKPLPHTFGWHPYFLATDKRQTRFFQTMRRWYDIPTGQDGPMPAALDLWEQWDDVFHTPEDCSFRLENLADGYAVTCRFGETQPVLVVCTTVPEAVCIEPWCGVPDAPRHGRFLTWVAPGEMAEYHMELAFETISQ
ncbi:MAG: hypothetical protein HFF17_10165 [Oscillospiraceae bacterium]|nr:hypothetical protein [Oscillospiraceae bacterium]